MTSVVPPSSSFYQTAVPKCGDDVFCSRIFRVDRDYAMFADASYDILHNLTINGGLRGFIATNSSIGFSGGAGRIAKCITPSNDPGTPCILFDRRATQSGETHKLNLSWKIDRDHLLYATYSTGYRPGGINRLPQVNPYAADTISNYEVGVKTSWFARKLVVRALRFLKTKNIRPDGFDEFGDVIDPQPHRVDVPGRDGKAHLVVVRARVWSSWSGRKPRCPGHPRLRCRTKRR